MSIMTSTAGYLRSERLARAQNTATFENDRDEAQATIDRAKAALKCIVEMAARAANNGIGNLPSSVQCKHIITPEEIADTTATLSAYLDDMLAGPMGALRDEIDFLEGC